MRLSNSISNSKTFLVSSEQFFYVFFFLWWTRYTFLVFFTRIFKGLPIIGPIAEYIIPTFMAVMLGFALPYIFKQLRYKDLLFGLLALLVVLGTMLLYSKNAPFIQEDLWRILGLTISAYFLGLCYNHQKLKKSLYWASAASVVLMYAYQLYQLSLNRDLSTDNMYASYNALPSVLFLIYWAFDKKKLCHWILPVVGIVLIFSYGTRGSILVLGVYIAANCMIKVFLGRRGLLRILFLFIIVAFVVLLFTTTILEDMAENLSELFYEFGFSTRIFDYFIGGKITDDSGRSPLFKAVWQNIKENPVLGSGFYGDRPVIGSYVHNLFLELWCHYGIILGTLAILCVFILPIRAVTQVRRADSVNMVLLLCCLTFVKLMVTGTYADEPYLFLMIGLSTRLLRQKPKSEVCDE